MPSANQRDLFTTLGLLFEASATIQRGIEADIEGATGLPGPWFETLLRLERSDAQGVRVSDMANQVSFAPSSFSRPWTGSRPRASWRESPTRPTDGRP
jgi:hypothetical protein